MAQAIVRSLAVSAARGDPRAQRLFIELLATTERETGGIGGPGGREAGVEADDDIQGLGKPLA